MDGAKASVPKYIKTKALMSTSVDGAKAAVRKDIKKKKSVPQYGTLMKRYTYLIYLFILFIFFVKF